MAKEFHKDYIKNDKVKVYVDQKLALYNALEMKRMGTFDVLSLKVLSGGKRAIGKGLSQGSFQGDTFQLGGMFMFDNNKMIYSHIETFAGDLPDFDTIQSHL